MERPEETSDANESRPFKPALLTRKAAAERLSISTRTLDRLANAGFIDRIFLGTVVRFRTEDVDRISENGV